MAATIASREVERVKLRDRDFDGHQGVLIARMAAVVGAQRALASREEGAAPALRQGLIDLAAISELLADELPTEVIR